MASKSSHGPSRDWLNPNLGYTHTSHARDKIRQWFKKLERAENIARGREMVEKELRRLGVSLPEVQEELLRVLRYDDLDDLLQAVGYGGVGTHQIAKKLVSFLQPEEVATLPTEVAPRKAAAVPSVRVLGTGDLLTRIARCCNPVPGDEIIGYVTRGEGVTVHRRDCHNVIHQDERERLVDVEWGRRGQHYPVAVHIEAWDRVGLLRDVSTMVAEDKVNMVGVRTEEHDDGTISILATLETSGIEQLTRLLSKLEMVRGVMSVSRRLEGVRREG